MGTAVSATKKYNRSLFKRRLQRPFEKVRRASPDLWDQKANSWNASAQGLGAVSVRTELELLWEQFRGLKKQIELLPGLKVGAEKVSGRLRPPEKPPPFLTPALNAGSVFSKIDEVPDSGLKVLNLRASFNGRPEELSRQANGTATLPTSPPEKHNRSSRKQVTVPVDPSSRGEQPDDNTQTTVKQHQVAPWKKLSSPASTRDEKATQPTFQKEQLKDSPTG